MKNFLVLGLALLAFSAYSSDKGNGGSGDEAEIVSNQAQIETVSLKLKNFFIKNRRPLKKVFPEVDIGVLLEKIDSAELKVVAKNELIDKNGTSRSCLNFPQTNLIECKSSAVREFSQKPLVLFVLMFHEYLGLMGVEETSPNDPTLVNGYAISKRLSPFFTKVNDYDLRMLNAKTGQEKPEKCMMTVDKNISGDLASLLKNKGYNLTFELKEGFYYLRTVIKTTWGHTFCFDGGEKSHSTAILMKKDLVDLTVDKASASTCGDNPSQHREVEFAAVEKLQSCND